MRRRLLPTIFDDLNEFYNVFSDSNCCVEGKSCCKTTNEGLSISEDDGRLYIDASMPGVCSEDTEVTLDPKKRSLIIRGEAKASRDNVKYHLRGSQRYNYEIPLSNEIDLDSGIEALSKNGVLSIALAKSKSHKPLKIDVKVA